ncbi:hypothetical protein MRX96_056684 [Rhipicephalus microplus]
MTPNLSRNASSDSNSSFECRVHRLVVVFQRFPLAFLGIERLVGERGEQHCDPSLGTGMNGAPNQHLVLPRL